ncbi:hypothetical protein [Dietzia cercidiphylli]|uniref:hypothetical protein n=1 Tax=Dietzia cercidiphylli TaxID=498199 RepID=UPI00223C4AE3|nr:hypothetical protein [Dietzia cercidiphylli]MCT1514610.1 hypothetical protein [Dietzia cercidiphylli]
MNFLHYLSYGSTDQLTARELTGLYDGLLIPGTVAAFQADGTRGFVLTLSAAKEKPYLIDSRFPLFQNLLPSVPKKSHASLARVFDDPGLISSSKVPEATDFSDARCRNLAQKWVDFNVGYTTVNVKHFSKYAKRLGEELEPKDSKLPKSILAPYFMCDGIDDPWWAVSKKLFEYSVESTKTTGHSLEAVRVIASKDVQHLDRLLNEVPESHVAVWVNNLNELDATIDDLATYGIALRRAADRKTATFALYGGYFSATLSKFGLVGGSHGIGYGEHRRWEELPNSGPPPARYYLPKVHRYVAVELAEYLWNHAPSLIGGSPLHSSSPIALEYHDLMKHSVSCRHDEIEFLSSVSHSQIVSSLRDDYLEFTSGLAAIGVPAALGSKFANVASHLTRWADALEMVGR